MDHEEVEAEEPLTREARIINNYKVIRGELPTNIKDEFVKMLTAQAMHETGVFTSKLYLEQNNLFGMTQPTIRETLSVGGRNGWANFANLEDSAKDLLLYFKEFNINPADKAFLETERHRGVNAYLKLIKAQGYFEQDYMGYYNAVKKHLSTVKGLIQ
ncbi:MAG: glucosaminidase domain-containing protein [Rhodospirillaceae bacterium]|nr:glucosaminidase domain-containing protein [Rhodospirillaceae bacterium]